MKIKRASPTTSTTTPAAAVVVVARIDTCSSSTLQDTTLSATGSSPLTPMSSAADSSVSASAGCEESPDDEEHHHQEALTPSSAAARGKRAIRGVQLENIIWESSRRRRTRVSNASLADESLSDADAAPVGMSRGRSLRASSENKTAAAATTAYPNSYSSDRPKRASRSMDRLAAVPSSKTGRRVSTTHFYASKSTSSLAPDNSMSPPIPPSQSSPLQDQEGLSASGVPAVPQDPQLTLLRSYWEFAAVAQFFHLFSDAFRINWTEHLAASDTQQAQEAASSFESYYVLPAYQRVIQQQDEKKDFETEDLEEQLLAKNAPKKLIDLHVKLLRILTMNRFINAENWLVYFRQQAEKYKTPVDSLLPENAVYDSLSLHSKVVVLLNLCEWQLEQSERFRMSTKDDNECQHWRVDPVGWDSKGNTYWLFDDNRLYMEEPLWIPATKKSGYPSHKRKLRAGVGVTIESSDTTTPPNDSGKIIINELEAAAEAAGITRKWTPVCLSSADWRRFPRQFANSKSEVEKDFYEFLINHALPHVVPHIEAKEKRKQDEEEARERQRKFEEAMMMRKRSSRLQIKQIGRMEEEKKKQEEEEKKRIEEAEKAKMEKFRISQELRSARGLRTAMPPTAEEREEYAKKRAERVSKRQRGFAYGSEDGGGKRMALFKNAEGVSKKSTEQMAGEDPWLFDCLCGVKGQNLDDGRPMIACGKCNTWQHIECLTNGQGPEAASALAWESEDFICRKCNPSVKEIPFTVSSSSSSMVELTEPVSAKESINCLVASNPVAASPLSQVSHADVVNGMKLTPVSVYEMSRASQKQSPQHQLQIQHQHQQLQQLEFQRQQNQKAQQQQLLTHNHNRPPVQPTNPSVAKNVAQVGHLSLPPMGDFPSSHNFDVRPVGTHLSLGTANSRPAMSPQSINPAIQIRSPIPLKQTHFSSLPGTNMPHSSSLPKSVPAVNTASVYPPHPPQTRIAPDLTQKTLVFSQQMQQQSLQTQSSTPRANPVPSSLPPTNSTSDRSSNALSTSVAPQTTELNLAHISNAERVGSHISNAVHVGPVCTIGSPAYSLASQATEAIHMRPGIPQTLYQQDYSKVDATAMSGANAAGISVTTANTAPTAGIMTSVADRKEKEESALGALMFLSNAASASTPTVITPNNN